MWIVICGKKNSILEILIWLAKFWNQILDMF